DENYRLPIVWLPVRYAHWAMEWMTEGVAHNDRLLSASEFFSRARKRPTFDVPAGLVDPNIIPRRDELDTDPAVIAAIAAMRPIRPAVCWCRSSTATSLAFYSLSAPHILPTTRDRFRSRAERLMSGTK